MQEAYDGSSDPTEHVAAFYAQMTLYGTSDAIMEFESNFLSSARRKPTVASLLGMRQMEEHLGQNLTCFIDECVTTETLVVEKHEDQKHPLGKPSRGPPSGLSRRRMERSKQTMPRLLNVPLNSIRTEIFLQIREKGLLKTPNPLRSRAEDRDRRRYCRFHCDYGHNTEDMT
ncbi:hypothetical protein B296_00011516 [Ensete ventricosum]|uniref:Retrotransposon gag domain-containing protein n=1 Tax=Ensete ventricosum TaxID=4639 RepID=A0A426ZLI9_ENSVE|nr:hypothetical protein B296_00011516 [Ensete ventricosum]